jgi:hypothetical protein
MARCSSLNMFGGTGGACSGTGECDAARIVAFRSPSRTRSASTFGGVLDGPCSHAPTA